MVNDKQAVLLTRFHCVSYLPSFPVAYQDSLNLTVAGPCRLIPASLLCIAAPVPIFFIYNVIVTRLENIVNSNSEYCTFISLIVPFYFQPLFSIANVAICSLRNFGDFLY